ncbi:MAG: bifunctional aminoglycoside phosphotransferase/ATP-binding protein [Thermodesulfobacteriota bacterium]|nr:MAG: bifunctional aminoglycoside phosphotransferase/ATP-binding protein [Thermodesulfobacteriota bacterium]
MELPPLISSLLRPGAYPGADHNRPIELIQTHISYILLTPSFAYKIKKPVDFGFLDFTTLDRRLRMCAEEVRLNSRLAPAVYIGVVKITGSGGEFFMEGEGEAAEYAVKMRRLPAEGMLDKQLASGRAGKAAIVRIAGVIASFHAKAARSARISAFGSPEAIGANAAENFAQTLPFIGKGKGKTISAPLHKKIKTFSDGFLKENEALFLERVEEGFIRDCHGDLHCEHISVGDGGDGGDGDNGVEIIDCIEFNERFRFSDTISDAAFLSMDLDFRGRHDLSLAFDEAYITASGDLGGRRLLDFYRCYRAYVRGKVEGFKSVEEEVGTEEKARAAFSARFHFHLSSMYADKGYCPMMVVVRGLSGTGKSTVAGALSSRTGFTLLSSDRIRRELAGLAASERAPAPFKEGIYSPEFTAKTYDELLKRAAALLASGRPVILDATFPAPARIERALEAALSAGAFFHLVECACSDELARERMEKRRAQDAGKVVSDADWGVYVKQKKGFEPWPGPALKLDTARPLEELISSVALKIFD